ncbi:NAD(P)H-quinone oxidoreductase [Acidocella aminolytica]|jgi:NADPH2:quinone reductase|uniref:Alcohol dehydrogenase n=1 Tax=Acidocella aminolytica 101 = DSM 11237 TaxID=1120923 RepID=A0A0D6PKI2_9PROT|nr:NAD(P)H-quinone oxidoreductase [Acidocella aminolytica]GAN81244.1 alcohol dehydrogenase [Acidocella aminolytica 101 = DSM 11237]GBQ41164.1 zinc-dependent alcohol dehydrogenase [Acidocella aminolytica 101 = DSM 11237]SHE84501.1 putative NAD(P)H quinone oxidoreductase, PIG3 family [Acidocella aminolytica 101 = DSM 11237]
MILPETMHFIDIPTPGGPEAMVLAKGQLPVPKDDEVLIRVQVAGVNRPDVMQRKGLYPPPPGASPVPGLEVAGEIAALGPNASGFYPGHKVTALCNGGGYAEYVTVPCGQCLPWPDGYDALKAAALPENFFTVWANVFDMAGLKPEESLLVHGGTSGIGLTALQLARAHGSTVFATAGSDEKCAFIARYGATAINYKTKDFQQVIAEATDKRGVDVILDMVGGSYIQRNIKSLAPRGRLVQVAFQQGAKAELDLLPVMLKRLTITGSTLRPRSAAEKAAIAASLKQKAWPLLERGAVTPVIDKVFDLEQVAQAHALMEASTHIGKILLRVAG